MAQITLNSSGVASNGSLLLQSNGTTTAVTIDTAQNMGLGVTPSAWSGAKGLQVGTLTSIADISGTSLFGCNYYYNGTNNIAIGTSAASRYYQTSGEHYWQTAGAGAAGRTISFTTAMTLDASGNLLLGTTTSALSSSGRGVLEINGASSAVSALKVGNAVKAEFFTDGTDLYILNDVNGAMRLYTNSIERARITSGGDLLVGKTAADTTNAGFWAYKTATNAGRINIIKTSASTESAIANYYSGTYVGGVDYSNTATSFPTSSDIRLKKDISDAGSASVKIDQIRIVSHGWKHDAEVVEFGVIAQELNLVAPQAVIVGDNDEEIGKTWGVDYSKLVPILIKAHQEQQSIIQTLTDRITALEQA